MSTPDNQVTETDYSKLTCVNVSNRRPAKWYMYVVKRVLRENGETEVRARPSGADQVIRVTEALKRLGYLNIVNYFTTSLIDERGIDRFLVVKVKRTPEFMQLYDDREKERTKMMEQSTEQK